MSFRRVGGLIAVALATFLWGSCGEVYRPVVIPTTNTPPNPANFHAVFGISSNVSFNQGTAMQIDVSGDSDIGVANVGVNPTHLAALPNNSRLFVASAGSLFAGQADLVASFNPATDSTTATGLGMLSTATLPYGSLPVYVTTTQSSTVYVANYGTNSVSAIDAINIVVDQTTVVGNHPVALVETPNGQSLYVLNQGDNTITNLSTTDLTPMTTVPATIAVGKIPVWAAMRPDGQRLYVLAQGDGQLYTIDTATNLQVQGSPQSVGGPGANYVLYDTSRNRLYVTNPDAGAVYVFDATTDPPTPMGSATGAISIPRPPIPANTPACTSGKCSYGPVMPMSVAALPDGSRFYVASYVQPSAGSPCPDPNVTAAGCLIPQVTVFDAGNFYMDGQVVVKSTVFPILSPVTTPASGVQPFALAPAAFCAPVVPYTPASARFRMSAAAAADSSRVYASLCDGGLIAIVNTTTSTIATGSNSPDTFVTDLVAPFSAGTPGSNGEPPPQNPVFLLTGQ